ncbi:AVAST type 2 anti-phage system protein Avs2 [Acidobacteriota bacterium]
MKINWQNLRPLDGSQNTAFEELCCQLAEYERVPEKSEFIPKGSPDAGVECLWKLPNGDERGWQAKFFLSPPDKNQWVQIDHSVKTAIEKHPGLVSYTVCLPIDRSDPRIEGQKWFMDKWNESVKKWKKWAEQKRMPVEFLYWGEHEIWERLSREEHRGRYFFWFNKELFSQQWFENRIEESIANSDPRYSPQLNVELPIARLFDGLGLTSAFYNRIINYYSEIKRAYSNVHSKKAIEIAKDQFNSLEENMCQLLSVLESLEQSRMDFIDFNHIAELASKSGKIAWECSKKLREADEKKKKQTSRSSDQPNKNLEQESYNLHQEAFGNERHYLRELMNNLDSLCDYTKNNEVRLANVPALLLVGKAGTGKTHLFCDIASHRISSGLPTVLLLGEHFNKDEPWSQIVRFLSISCSNKEEFLGALQTASEVMKSKALIFIDALNEGQGKILWQKHIGGILKTLSRYPRIGIAISVRTSYEEIVIPGGLVPDSLVREEHQGFAAHEYQATQTFFDYFGIERPGVPLLVPEFQNPLFLKLFCQGLKNQGLTKIPAGLKGITAIFDFFVESVNKKLSRPEYLNFDQKLKFVHKAVARMAEMMADKGVKWLPREEAQSTINVLLHSDGYEHSLFRHMISEGILAEDRYYIREDNKWCEGIHFSYERFADHLIALFVLDKHLNSENYSNAFLSDQPLGAMIKNETECWLNCGLIEAICIQLPERIQKELIEVAPGCAAYQPVREAFVESLVWRKPNAITEITRQYINDFIVRYSDTHDQFLEVLLTVASNPNHPYNADFLHNDLLRFELAERDAWWTIFLNNQYGEHGVVDRLVEWAWSQEDKSRIDDNSIRLCGIALAWFLTSSNRFLRDRATKALVSLLSKRIHILRGVIGSFLQVNDPYILERLLAVAYGCAMRSTDNEAISKLAKDLYKWIFKSGEPIPHILLRDYARGVIEFALHRGVELEIDVEKIRPPYKSEWPPFEIPTKDELKKYGEWQEGMPDEERARVHLYQSVMGFGDFARYIIGTNHRQFRWSTQRLGEPRERSPKEMYENFIQSLTNKQKKYWERYQTAFRNSIKIIIVPLKSREFINKREFERDEKTGEELEAAFSKSEQSFKKTIGKKKLKIFEEHVLPYLNDPKRYEDENCFDFSIAQRWIFKKVLNLGWTVERFGNFDRDLGRFPGYRRSSHKPERIGKKYQWIAYHEFLARISDNFEFETDYLDDECKKYEGPWQIDRRDIDPSCLIKKTGKQDWLSQTNTWWFPIPYDAWESEPDDIVWLKSSKDLPSIEHLIEVINPKDNSQWLVLETSYTWEQPTPPGEDSYENKYREIWYMLRSCIVRKSDINELFKWAKNQNFMGRWMPEYSELHDVFLGEFFWAPAFQYHGNSNNHHEGWTKWPRGGDKRIPREVLVSAVKYVQETPTYDCSIDDTISIYLPTKWLADNMKLQWNGIEGHFFNDKGNLIAFDPSVTSVGPGALLINRDAFMKFLDENGYDILWTILGEKEIIGGGFSDEDWKGLEISGAYRILENKVDGEINKEFRSRD